MLMVLPVVLVLGALPATPIAVVDVDAPDAMMGLSAQVTKAVLDGAKAMNLAPMEPDEVRKKLDPKRYQELKACGGKPACAASYLQALGIKTVVLGSVGRDERNYLLKLWLIDVTNMNVIADVDRQVLIAARRFQRDVEQAVPPLLRGEREPRGTLVITCRVANAQVTVNGEFLGTAPQTLTVKPGKYEVKVERNKYLPVSRLMTVEANQKTEEAIELLLKPGELPDDASPLPTLTSKPKTAAPEAAGTPLNISAPTWVFAGLTVASLAVGGIFGGIAAGQDKSLKGSLDMTTGVYSLSRSLALDAQRNALIANIGFAAAAGFGIATVVFVVLDAVTPQPVQVTPTVSQTGAGVSLSGSF